MKMVHWPLMGGLLHLVQRRGDWAGPQPAQAPPYHAHQFIFSFSFTSVVRSVW